MRDAPARNRLSAALQAGVAAISILLVGAALLADQSWWDRHFLPVFFFSHDKYVLGESLVRIAGMVAGAGLFLFVRPALGRIAGRMRPRTFLAATLRIILAIALALAVAELALGHRFAHAAAETQPGEEPVRQPDRRLGWVFTPSHDGTAVVGDRKISYSTDAHGYRVPSHDHPVDPALPSILFTGESIIAGYGLNWDETIPAQVGAALKMQSASIAVFGYANDQAYLRLVSELPRFRRPVAVVSLFIPSLFARNLGDDRPHLAAGMRWMPAVHRARLSALARFVVPYHSEAEIAQGIASTRAELLASASLARQHGAMPLVVDPQFGPESLVEQMLRRRILDEPKIAYVQVKLDPSWHLKGDLHPDPRAAHAIAMAIVARLQAGVTQQ